MKKILSLLSLLSIQIFLATNVFALAQTTQLSTGAELVPGAAAAAAGAGSSSSSAAGPSTSRDARGIPTPAGATTAALATELAAQQNASRHCLVAVADAYYQPLSGSSSSAAAAAPATAPKTAAILAQESTPANNNFPVTLKINVNPANGSITVTEETTHLINTNILTLLSQNLTILLQQPSLAEITTALRTKTSFTVKVSKGVNGLGALGELNTNKAATSTADADFYLHGLLFNLGDAVSSKLSNVEPNQLALLAAFATLIEIERTINPAASSSEVSTVMVDYIQKNLLAFNGIKLQPTTAGTPPISLLTILQQIFGQLEGAQILKSAGGLSWSALIQSITAPTTTPEASKALIQSILQTQAAA